MPGGEQLEEFQARCCAGFRRIEPLLPPDIHTAWVIHGGVIMALLEAYARPARNFYDYHIGNGGYVRCSCREGILHVEEIRTPE